MKQLKLFSLGFALLISGLTAKSQQSCPVPTGLTSTNITTNTAVVKWKKVSGAAYYVVSYGVNSTALTTKQTSDTLTTLTGLLAATPYYWAVQTYCLVPGTTQTVGSGYSPYSTFTTLHLTSCYAPTKFTYSNLTSTAIILKWGKVSGACYYNVKYFAYGTTDTISHTFTDTAWVITGGLKPATYYHWRVQSICCNNAGTSPWSKDQIFTTLAACNIPPSGSFTTTAITQTSAQITWGAVDGACNYYIVYYPTSTPTATKVRISKTNTFKLDTLTAGTAYTWKVRSQCCTGTQVTSYSDFGPLQPFTTLSKTCAVPLNLKVTNVTATSVTLSWDAVSGVYLYLLEYWNSTTVNSHSKTNTSATSITITGLTPNTYYEWKVQTYCGNGVLSDFSLTSNFTTLGTATCTAPAKQVNGEIGATSVIIKWSKVDGACTYNIKYFVYGTKDTLTASKTAPDTILTLTGLKPGTYYHWRVQTVCCNASIPSPWSHDQIFTTLQLPCSTPPSGFSINYITQTSAQISWGAVTGACKYYIMYYPTNNPTASFVRITANTTYKLDTLIPGTAYTWKVKTLCCTNGQISSYSDFGTLQTFSTLAKVNCIAPINLKVTNITATSVTLSWDAVSGVYLYMIEYWNSATANNHTKINSQTNSITITGLTPNTYYEWKVQTYCGSGVISDFSVTSHFTTLGTATCAAPAKQVNGEIGATSVIIKWSKVDGACTYNIKYFAYGTKDTLTASKTAPDTTLTLTGLKPGTYYHWKVQTVCCNASIPSPWSHDQIFTTLQLPCSTPPTGFSINYITQTSAQISWGAVTGACKYYIVYYPTDNPNATIVRITANTTYKLDTLTPGTIYTWKVKTLCCTNGQISSYSDFGPLQSFLTLAKVNCIAPINLKVTNITATSVTLSWDAVTNVYIYMIEYWNSSTANNHSTVNSQTNSITITGLTPNTVYEWYVRTYCGSGVMSDYSLTSHFTTLQLNDCLAPTKLVNSNLTSTSLTISWNKVPTACYYIIKYFVYGTKDTITKSATDTTLNITGLTPGTYYHWRVRTVCCNVGNSPWSKDQIFTTPASTICYPPVKPVTLHISQTSALLTWNKVPNACSYIVWVSTSTAFTTYKIATIKDTSLLLDTLKANTYYVWKVKTICCNQTAGSDFCPALYFKTLPINPPPSCTAPIKLSNDKLTATSIIIRWNKVAGACSYNIKYFIYGTKDTITKTATDTSLALTGLTPNTYYHWRVQTVCCSNTGTSPWSHDQIFTTLPQINCPVPLNLKVTNVTATSVTLSWDAVTNVYIYMIEYWNSSTANNHSTANSSTNSITITGLTPNTVYEWYVRTYCGSGVMSDFSVTSHFTTLQLNDCLAPIKLVNSNLTPTSLTISWNKVPTACYYIIKYFVYGTKDTITKSATDTTLNITGLTPGTYYHWRVRTVCCNVGNSPWSRDMIFTTPTQTNCVPPVNLKYSYLTPTSVVLSWDAAAGSAYTYLVEYWNSTTLNNHTKVTVTTNSATITGLTPNTYYEWKVQTYCGNGLLSDFSLTANFTTLAEQICKPPLHPVTLRITQKGAVLTWNKVPNACSYVVQYSNSTSFVPYTEVTTKDTAVVLENLTPNTYYLWKVRTICCNMIAGSDFTPVIYFKTLPSETCNPPAKFWTIEIGQTGVRIAWNKVEGNCGYVVTLTNYANYPTTIVKTFTTKDTVLTIGDLTPNTYYHWSVATACCNGTPSINGPDQPFMTLKQTCEIPTGMATNPISQSYAVISWNAVTGACGYYLIYYPANHPELYKVVETTLTKVTITPLEPNTAYEWKVRTKCCTPNSTTPIYSDYCPVQTFTTQQTNCNAPVKFESTNLTPTSITLKWNSVPHACSYNITYYPYNLGVPAIIVNTKDTLLNLTNLLSGITYYWMVQTVCCNDMGISVYGPIQKFTTPVPIACLAPKAITVLKISTTSVSLSWDAVEGICGYSLSYNIPGVTDFTTITTQNTYIIIDNLLPNTQYHLYIHSICCNGGLSSTFADVNFKTYPVIAPCNAPVNLSHSYITQNSAVLTWDAVTGAMSYLVQYWVVGYPDQPMFQQTTANHVQLTGLLPNTKYEWKVKTYCSTVAGSTNNTSDWSVTDNFTTLAVPQIECKVPQHPATLNITQTSAVLVWNKVPHACYYIINLYEANSPMPAFKTFSTKDTSLVLTGLIANKTYQWQVQTKCCDATTNAVGESEFTPLITFTTLPYQTVDCLAPKVLNTTNVTQRTATISWNPVKGAAVYLIAYWSDTDPNNIIYLKTQDTVFNLTGLTPNTKYSWKVKTYCLTSSTNIDYSSDWSQTTGFATLSEPLPSCVPPDILVNGTITQNSALLKWNKVQGATSYNVIYYPKNSPTSAYKSISTKDTSAMITGLIPNTEYVWKVKTICCGPTSTTPCYYSTDSWLQDFTTLQGTISKCLPPANPVSTNITSYSVVLKWNHSENACYYMVYYNSEITMQPGYLIVSTKDTSVTLTNLISNMDYEWKVKTICCTSAGTTSESDFTQLQFFKTLPVQEIKCYTPENPNTAKITSTSAVISWNPAVNACSYLVVYYISGSTTPAYKYIKTTETTATLLGLLPNTKYEWEVKSICCNSTVTSGQSEFTAPQIFTTLPGEQIKCLAPTVLASGNITQTGAYLKWEPVPNACSYVVLYYYMDVTNTPMYFYVKTPTPYVNLTGLIPGKVYSWKVQTICCSTSANLVSDFSIIQTFKTLEAPVNCNPPKFLATKNITGNSAVLTWNKVEGASKYMITLWTGTSTLISQVVNNDTSFVVQNLLPGTVYQWKVQSVCYSNLQNAPYFSPFSYTVTFTTLPKPIEICLPPKDLVTTGITTFQASIGWSIVNSATYYIVAYMPVTSTGTEQFKYVISQTNKYLLRGLKPNTLYIWKVRSICGVSTSSNLYAFSDYSEPVTFTTPDHAVQLCVPPNGLKSYDITDTTAGLGWNPVTGVNLYLVVYNEANSTESSYMMVSDIKLALKNLKPSTKYIWKVGSVCTASGGFNIGKMSDTTSFVTKPKGGKKYSSFNPQPSASFKVYPNPTEGIINVEIENITSPANLSITNFAGQLVYEETLHNTANEIKEIDLSHQPKGIYFIKVMNNTTVKTLKLVIH